jgi:hypothetical protein
MNVASNRHSPEVVMARTNKKTAPKSAKKFISVRVDEEQKTLVKQAAESEGLQLSSFIIMLLVRFHVLPELCLKKIKRRPVPFFNELHALLGVVNNIGGNCKQLLAAMPELSGVRGTQGSLQGVSEAVTDALFGKSLPADVDLERHQESFRKIGAAFNDIVRSVNKGRPELEDLPEVLSAIRDSADALASVLTGKPVMGGEMGYVKDLAKDTMETAMEEMRANMRRKD